MSKDLYFDYCVEYAESLNEKELQEFSENNKKQYYDSEPIK